VNKKPTSMRIRGSLKAAIRNAALRAGMTDAAVLDAALRQYFSAETTAQECYERISAAITLLEAKRDHSEEAFTAHDAATLNRLDEAWEALRQIAEPNPARITMPNPCDPTRMFVAFSHQLTQQQRDDAAAMGITSIVTLSDTAPELQETFSQFPADAGTEAIYDFCTQLVGWAIRTRCGVFYCTGEPSITVQANTLARAYGLRCIQSTTRRDKIETPQPDGSVKTEQVFRHVMWRDVFVPDMPR